MGLFQCMLAGISPLEVREHEREEHDERKDRCPTWPGFPNPWVVRSRCDLCRQKLSYIASNLAVPRGTPIVCGPCTGGHDEDDGE